MISALRPSTLVLFAGDIICFSAALWLSVFIRSLSVPSERILTGYAYAFVPLLLVWVGVYFIAGLYERRRLILARRELLETLLITQLANTGLAALFFFFIPYFGIAPKTILFIYLGVSFLLILIWRTVVYPHLGIQRAAQAVVIGEGTEIEELASALENNTAVHIAAHLRPSQGTVAEEVAAAIERHQPSFVIADWGDGRVATAFPQLYNLLSRGIRFMDAMELYEEVFGRVPLSRVDDAWLARNVSGNTHAFYDSIKRIMDVAVAFPLSAVPALLFIVFAPIIKLQDGGPVFYRQVRTGQGGAPFSMLKFRSMSGTDQGHEVLKSKHTVTPFGKFLRVSRLDEFPQVWHVLTGDLSLIGPRPEFPSLVEEYARHIPHYQVRHLIKPGLSGWAQLYHDNHPHHGTAIEATREKLSYDLYYAKHRSLMLDGIIALKTIKKLLTHSGV